MNTFALIATLFFATLPSTIAEPADTAVTREVPSLAWYTEATTTLMQRLVEDQTDALSPFLTRHYDVEANADLTRFITLMEEAYGTIDSATVLGSRPHHQFPTTKVETFVKVRLGAQEQMWRMVWQDETLITITRA